MADRNSKTSREFLIEFRQVGNAVKVTAIDTVTGLEATIVGDPRFGAETLKRTAARKLRYLLAKRMKDGGTGGGGGTIA